MANEFFTALPLSESIVADAQHGATVPCAPEALGAARNPDGVRLAAGRGIASVDFASGCIAAG